jgi:uncharacterized membrane protein YfcA
LLAKPTPAGHIHREPIPGALVAPNPSADRTRMAVALFLVAACLSLAAAAVRYFKTQAVDYSLVGAGILFVALGWSLARRNSGKPPA